MLRCSCSSTPDAGRGGRTASARSSPAPTPGAFLGSKGTLHCTATLGGKAFPKKLTSIVSTTYQGTKLSAPVCLWQLPATAHGKRLRGTITVSYQGATVTRPFSAAIA